MLTHITLLVLATTAVFAATNGNGHVQIQMRKTQVTRNASHSLLQHVSSQGSRLAKRSSEMHSRRGLVARSMSNNVQRRTIDLDEAAIERRAISFTSVGNSQRTIGNTFADVYYFGVVSVGTPPVDYDTILDTGSSDFIIATSPCTSYATGNCGVTPLYYPEKSTTSIPVMFSGYPAPFGINYGTGGGEGVLRTDVISLGGFAVNQTFGALSLVNTIFVKNLSGLLGLGWAAISQTGSVPFIEGLWKDKRLSKPLFAFAIARWNTVAASKTQAQPGGYMDLGQTDPNLYTGEISQNPLVDTKGYWPIALKAVTVNDRPTGVSSHSVLIDSGTSLIGVPQSAADAIYAQIPGAQRWVNGNYFYPCVYPVTVAFNFGGVSYPMSRADFNNGKFNSTTCVGTIFSLGGEDEWIFGDAFLKNVYTVYSFEPPYVGFATLRDQLSLRSSGTPGKGTDTIAPGAAVDVPSTTSATVAEPAETQASVASLIDKFNQMAASVDNVIGMAGKA